MKKPPLGIKPHLLWKEEVINNRIKELRKAIDRRVKAGLPYPTEWYSEINALQFYLEN